MIAAACAALEVIGRRKDEIAVFQIEVSRVETYRLFCVRHISILT
jgi:hypothetical protein